MVRHAIAKERGFERARMAFLWCVEGGVPPNRYASNADVFYGSEYSEHTLSGTVIGSRPDGAQHYVDLWSRWSTPNASSIRMVRSWKRTSLRARRRDHNAIGPEDRDQTLPTKDSLSLRSRYTATCPAEGRRSNQALCRYPPARDVRSSRMRRRRTPSHRREHPR